jgi:hypothetical protein
MEHALWHRIYQNDDKLYFDYYSSNLLQISGAVNIVLNIQKQI